jgi:glycosyltransferase involved in cell wall biosynthesis
MTNFKSPNVLMFGWEFPPFNSGGLGVACEGLSKALSASGVGLTFVLPIKVPISVPWCKIVFANESDLVDETEIKSLFSGYNSHSQSSFKTGKYGLPEFVSGSLMQRVKAYALKAPAIARKNKHSVIHAHDWLTYPAGIAAKETSGRPLVVHVHATQFDQSAGDNVNREVFNVELEGYHRADVVIAISNRVKETLINKYKISPDKIKVVHNGVEFQKSNAGTPSFIRKIKDSGGKIVLFAGRITIQKGPDYFVAMAKKILEHEPNTFFIVSGSGDMEGQMIREVSRLGISRNFIFCGFLRGEELATIYRDSDIYVMPSVSEPFGILPLECMISDTPVLISKESGVSEVANCVLKSHFWDIDDMADKVISVLRHHKLKNHLRADGREEVKTIHWKKAAESLISVYNSLDNAFSMFLFPGSPAVAGAQIPYF